MMLASRDLQLLFADSAIRTTEIPATENSVRADMVFIMAVTVRIQVFSRLKDKR